MRLRRLPYRSQRDILFRAAPQPGEPAVRLGHLPLVRVRRPAARITQDEYVGVKCLMDPRKRGKLNGEFDTFLECGDF